MSRAAWVGLLALTLGLVQSTAEAAPTASDRVVQLQRVAVGVGDARIGHVLGEIEARRAALGLADARLRLRVDPRSGDPRKAEVVWIEGVHDTAPIIGPVARALIVNGELRSVLPTTLGALTAIPAAPRVSRESALARVAATRRPGVAGASEARLGILPGNTPRLVWIIDPPASLRHPTNPVFAVDALTGDVRMLFDRVRIALARAFLRNPSRDPVAGEYPLIAIDPGAQTLEGPYFRAVNCAPGPSGDCNLQQTAFANAQGNFFYPAPDVDVFADNVQPADPFAEVSMYYHADKFLAWLQGLGFDQLICHQQGQQAVLVANFVPPGETSFNNAFYTGDCWRTLVFGQGSEVDFSYDGDVVYHELGHGVVERQQGGGFLGWPHERKEALLQDAGALNEAMADFVSSAYSGDAVVGDYLSDYWAALPGPGVRNNDNRYVCPDDMVGEVHVDSEPFGGALWDAHRVFGDVIVIIALETIAALPRDASFEEAAGMFYTLSQGWLAPQAANVVAEILDRRGLFKCDRIIEHDGLRTRMFVEPAEDYSPFAPPPLQLTVDVPSSANTIDVTFTYQRYDGSFGGSGDVIPNVLVKRGAPIAFSYNDEAFLTTEVTHDADERFVSVLDGDVRIRDVRGTTVYLGFVNTGDAVMNIDDVAVEFSERPDDETDTGEPPPPPDPPSPDPGTHTGDDGATGTGAGVDGGKKGCGCNVPSAPPAAAVPLLLAFVRRRRQRR